jgi:hypothetical protein
MQAIGKIGCLLEEIGSASISMHSGHFFWPHKLSFLRPPLPFMPSSIIHRRCSVLFLHSLIFKVSVTLLYNQEKLVHERRVGISYPNFLKF